MTEYHVYGTRNVVTYPTERQALDCFAQDELALCVMRSRRVPVSLDGRIQIEPDADWVRAHSPNGAELGTVVNGEFYGMAKLRPREALLLRFTKLPLYARDGEVIVDEMHTVCTRD